MTPTINNEIRAAANQALIAGNPEYFSWSQEAQERFRATASKEARDRMSRILLKRVFDIDCTVEDASQSWNDLSLHQLNEINGADLLTRGIGEDSVYLNEILGEGVSLLDFETLYDYDYDNFLFQEECCHRDKKNYAGTGYFPLNHPLWIRLIMDNRLVYGSLYSLAGYVVSRVAENGDDRLDQLIPSTYVEGPKHGKPEKAGMLWDYRLEAGGQEPQLEELRRRWWRYQQDIEQSLQRELVGTFSQAYVIRDASLDPDEVNVNFVIQNEKAMGKVRWRSFLADIRDNEGNPEKVNAMIRLEKHKALSFIEQQHQDILDNYLPPNIKPGKELKLVMSPGALEDLQRFGGDWSEDD